MHRKALPLLLALCVLAACGKPTQTPPASQADQAVAPHAAAFGGAVEAWIGRWNGPEGTYLEVMEDGQQYKVAIRNLDGVRIFEAVRTIGRLSFERDGTTETIKPGSGNETGMKWLQDKSNCLVVKTGEAYCRG